MFSEHHTARRGRARPWGSWRSPPFEPNFLQLTYLAHVYQTSSIAMSIKPCINHMFYNINSSGCRFIYQLYINWAELPAGRARLWAPPGPGFSSQLWWVRFSCHPACITNVGHILEIQINIASDYTWFPLYPPLRNVDWHWHRVRLGADASKSRSWILVSVKNKLLERSTRVVRQER